MNQNIENEKLLAPLEYWYLTEEEIKSVTNGCGSKKTEFIPDSILGLDLSEACRIHDWMYYDLGTSKKEADEVFLINQKKLNKLDKASWLVKLLRGGVIYAYYIGVTLFGGNRYLYSKQTAREEFSNKGVI